MNAPNPLLAAALRYHAEGICVVPCKPRDKAVALPTWEEYQTRQSTRDEVTRWWAQMADANIGLVHGVNGYVAIDIDHDRGALEQLRQRFPALFAGRLEQSGSGEGYHVPLFLGCFPDLGYDNAKDRPKGNKTWKTPYGNINIRARWAQTVAPPSVHPSGGLYRHIQDGPLARVPDLGALIVWLNTLDRQAAVISRKQEPTAAPRNPGALDDLKRYFPSLVDTFARLGVRGETQKENGELRILGHGGLMVDERRGRWYSFADETGGDVIDAYGWVRYGQAWNRHDRRQFSEVLAQMKTDAGIGTERVSVPKLQTRARPVWGGQLRRPYWSK